MANKLAFIITLIFVSKSALATFTSIYEEPTGFPVYAYTEKASCEADGGMFEEDICFFTGKNIVEIDITKDDITRVSVETITTNGHSCSFESTQIKEVGNKITASLASEDYDYQTRTFKPVTCEVFVTKNADGSVAVDANGKCREFCGMRGYFGIDSAIKVK